MKLFVVALCVCAAMAEVKWDPSGQHRVIETDPIVTITEPEYKIKIAEPELKIKIAEPEYKIKITEPEFIKIAGTADARYRIIGAPLPTDYPLVYRSILDPALLYRPAEAVAVSSIQPFVYSYTQLQNDAKLL